jgi:pseudouridine synthase
MANPYTQRVTVDGRQIDTTGTRRYYVALHKPVGYVSTVADRHAEKKVTDLVHIPGARLVPAGRLDADSEGLILLSNDGDFIYRVTHPSQSLGKLYQATVKGKPSDEAIKTLTKGLAIGEGEVTAPAQAQLIGRGQEGGTWIVELTLGEGRNRQVRRMLDTVGHPVIRLVRLRVGPVRLGILEPGKWRELTADEVRRILTGDKSGEADGLSAGNGGKRPAPRKNNALPPQRPGSRPPQRPSMGQSPRTMNSAPPRSYAPRPPSGTDRPQQMGRPGQGQGGARPYNDRPRTEGPPSRPYQARPHGGEPEVSRPDSERSDSRPPRPGGGRPYNRPSGDRPYSGGQSGGRPSGDRPSGGDRPYNRPPGGRPTGGRPTGGGDRPYNNNRPSGGDRPQPRGNDAQGGGRERARPYYTGPKSTGQGPARPQGPRPPRPNNPNPNPGRPSYKNGGGRQ